MKPKVFQVTKAAFEKCLKQRAMTTWKAVFMNRSEALSPTK
jgi:hypothetical protein